MCLQVLDLANNARLTGRLEAAPQVKATDAGRGALAADLLALVDGLAGALLSY